MDARWIPVLVFLGVVIIAVLAGAQTMFSGPGDCGASDYRDLPPCELTTHPPDIKVFNRGTETAYVTITITDQRASEPLVSGRVRDVHTFEDELEEFDGLRQRVRSMLGHLQNERYTDAVKRTL